jgi:hypothetical protein
MREKRDWCISRSEVLAILGDEKVLPVEEIAVDVVHDPGSSVVWIWTSASIRFFHRCTDAVEVVGQLGQRALTPFTRHTPAP